MRSSNHPHSQVTSGGGGMARTSAGQRALRRLHSAVALSAPSEAATPSLRPSRPATPQQGSASTASQHPRLRSRWLAGPVRAAGDSSAQLQDLRKGVVYEANHGFRDIQGQKERFSEFASRLLRSMEPPEHEPQPQPQPQRPAGSSEASRYNQTQEALAPFTLRMNSYPELGHQDREALLRGLMESLNRLAGLGHTHGNTASRGNHRTEGSIPVPGALPGLPDQATISSDILRSIDTQPPAPSRGTAGEGTAQAADDSSWTESLLNWGGAHAAWAKGSAVATRPGEGITQPPPVQGEAMPVATTRSVEAETPQQMQSQTSSGGSSAAPREQEPPGVSPPQPSVLRPTVSGSLAGAGGAIFKGEQRSQEWHKLRDGRLTASAFGNALGPPPSIRSFARMWSNGRVELWEEKLGLRPKFQGNAATAWGTGKEETALADYCRLTGHDVSEECMFKVLRDDPVHSWLGASPDGIIVSSRRPGTSGSPGVLEIKCPYNRGRPEEATPYPTVPYYYMPQVQGLMAIFDLDWCDVFAWTPNGGAIYHVPRNEEYWGLMYRTLGEFWWENLVPAKHALAKGDLELAETFRPERLHVNSARLTDWSKQLASEAPIVTRS